MAFQRFANLTEDDIDAFQENAINKNTKHSTKYWMSVVKAWTEDSKYSIFWSKRTPGAYNLEYGKFSPNFRWKRNLHWIH